MNRKGVLKLFTIGLGFAGIVALSVPFLLSLNPSAKADAALPRIDISHIEPGTFDILDFPAPNDLWRGFHWSLFVMRLRNGSIKAWEVPVKDHGVGMPDIHWWKPLLTCNDFGPAIVAGKIDESSHLRCHDVPVPSEWWDKTWRWNFDGEHVGRHRIDDMLMAKGVVEGNFFVYGKRQ